MKYANGRVSDVQIAYIGGGSRGMDFYDRLSSGAFHERYYPSL